MARVPVVRPRRRDLLRTRGLRIIGPEREEVLHPRLITADEVGGGHDAVLLSVKAAGLTAALDDLAPAVGERTAVIPFLNGIAHLDVLNQRFAPIARLRGEIAAVPGGSEFAAAVVAEAAAVSAAAGHPSAEDALAELCAVVTQPGSPYVPSMYRDLSAGRPTEVEHVFGDLVARAEHRRVIRGGKL